MADNFNWNTDGDLNFTSAWINTGTNKDATTNTASISYLFSAFSMGAITYVFDIEAETVLSSPESDCHFQSVTDIEAACELSSPVSDCTVINDINVDQSIKTELRSSYEYADSLHNNVNAIHADSPQLFNAAIIPVNDGDKLQNYISAFQGDLPPCFDNVEFKLLDGDKVQGAVSTINIEMGKVRSECEFTVYDGDDLIPEKIQDSYFYPPRADCAKSTYWMELDDAQVHFQADFEDGEAIKKSWANYFEDANTPTLLRPDEPVGSEPIVEPLEVKLDFLRLWENSGELDFLYIELDALIIMNEISIYHIADNGTKTAIHPVSASLELDIDSQVWSFKGQLFGADSLTWLTYRANFEINVNGHQLLFVLREYSRSSSFASDAYTFTAVTNTQWLFSPYANLYSGAVENETGVWQIVEDILTQESFTLNRALTPEWILAPDSFSYLNKTPIEMAIQAAQASGAILQPNKTGNSLDVQPRYKVSPWNWNTLTDEQCDHVINADYVITESSSDNTTTEINRVLISGETHGVITDVVKSGTAGDVRGSDVVSNLSQDHNVNMELARNMMGDSGDQEILGLSLPLLSPDSDFGLLLPGEIVRIVYTDKSITGLCLSNSIPIQSITDVSQSVKLELNNGYR